jgi:hypothetical protein
VIIKITVPNLQSNLLQRDTLMNINQFRSNFSFSTIITICFILIFPFILNPILFFFQISTIDYLVFPYSIFFIIGFISHIYIEFNISFYLYLFILAISLPGNLIFWTMIYIFIKKALYKFQLKQSIYTGTAYFFVLLVTALIGNHFLG